MAKGKTHDYIGLGAGFALTVILLVKGLSFLYLLCFLAAWLFATLIFSPDTDLMPKKRAGILRFFLFPYSIIFKHRGLSHRFLVGTVSRLVYLIAVVALIIFVTNKMGYLDLGVDSYSKYAFTYLSNFNLGQDSYLCLFWFLVGHFGSDATHTVLDRIS